MPYIGRGQVGDIIQPVVMDGIFDPERPYTSVIMTMGDRINVPSKEVIVPIIGTRPVAEFVEKTGTQALPTAGTYPAVPVEDAPDIGYKPVSNLTIADARLVAEKLAVIIPVSDCVLEDLPDEEAFRNLIISEAEKAIALRFDQAALLGQNPPATYGVGIIPSAIAAGNVVDVAPTATAVQKLDALGAAMDVVENAGYVSDGIAAATRFFGIFRRATTSNPNILVTYDMITNRPTYSYFGITITDAKALNGTAYLAVVGQWSNVKWGVRSDFQVTELKEATIVNADGTTLNLAQQDMTGYRVVLRIGYVVLATAGTYPLGVVRETAAEEEVPTV